MPPLTLEYVCGSWSKHHYSVLRAVTATRVALGFGKAGTLWSQGSGAHDIQNLQGVDMDRSSSLCRNPIERGIPSAVYKAGRTQASMS